VELVVVESVELEKLVEAVVDGLLKLVVVVELVELVELVGLVAVVMV
jgi:hypothetical protein